MKRCVKLEILPRQCSHCRRRGDLQRATTTFCSGRQATEWRCLNCGAHPAKPVL